MRASRRHSGLVLSAAVAAILGLADPAAADGADDPGRQIAERFARDKAERTGIVRRPVRPAPSPDATEEQRLIEEIDMLERARAEADWRQDQMTKAADGERPPVAERRGGADRAVEDAERARTEAARAEAEAREAAEAQRQAAEERRIAEEHRLETERRRAEQDSRDEARRQAEADRREAAERLAAEQRERAEKAEMAQMEAEREAEADRLEEVLKRARELRDQRARNAAPPEGPSFAAGETPRRVEIDSASSGRSGEGETHRHSASRWSSRVTVLMVMDAGNRGIRRHNKTGDPILCGERGCYVSAGADRQADLFPMRRALGAGRTLGARAGACSNSLGCVFRGIDLVAFPAIVQPIDMRLVRHDRRQPQVLHETSVCTLDHGRLACTGFQGPDYTMWVVPEELAAAAGPAALERAVDAGLRDEPTHGFRSAGR